MLENKWIIVFGKYKALEEQAVNRISAAVSTYTGYVLPVFSADKCTDELIKSNNIILVGTSENKYLRQLSDEGIISTPEGEQGYAIKVCDSAFNPDMQMILISGYDAAGVLYGAVDFENKYIGKGMLNHDRNYRITSKRFFDEPFTEKMPNYELTSAPSFKMRGIWTWGHCIFNYREFFENMVRLKLNHIVIWNDFVPVNAKKVVEYAHGLGIKLYWGFSWGWRTKFDFERYATEPIEVMSEWAERIEGIYEDQLADSGADGIYFQSFTDTSDKEREGICIADVVIRLVNYIGQRLLDKYPDLVMQFGLHATSVNDKLEYIKKLDKRIHIIWEDCGAFPYSYHPKRTEGFEETKEFNKKIFGLRGEGDKNGAVLKGMTTLDWLTFEHQSGSYVMGESHENYVAERTAYKQHIWKYLQAHWIKNAGYAADVIKQIKELTDGGALMQMLVEDGCFENQVFYPAAITAEMYWNADADAQDILSEVAFYPCVKFANLP